MGGQLTNLSYDEWLMYVFDHPVDDAMPAWHFAPNADWWNELDDPAITVCYLTQAFESIEIVAQPYTDAQLNQGLWFLLSNACSSHMFALMDENVPWQERERCIQSFSCVYERLFVPRCTPHLSHLLRGTPSDPQGVNPLNSACYMWWDIVPLGGKPDDTIGHRLNHALLDVMERALALDSIACQESALHGLGHWCRYYPDTVTATIDAYLKRQPALPQELKTYALSARGGCVL